MNYGKNQLALLKFLEKYPNRWHRIKRRKAIDAAKGLLKKDSGVYFMWSMKGYTKVFYKMPQMLQNQA
jgi:hypothetical protein